jgi:hypothetical protein
MRRKHEPYINTNVYDKKLPALAFFCWSDAKQERIHQGKHILVALVDYLVGRKTNASDLSDWDASHVYMDGKTPLVARILKRTTVYIHPFAQQSTLE